MGVGWKLGGGLKVGEGGGVRKWGGEGLGGEVGKWGVWPFKWGRGPENREGIPMGSPPLFL